MQNQAALEYALDWLSGDTSTYDDEAGSMEVKGIAFVWYNLQDAPQCLPVHSPVRAYVDDKDWLEVRGQLLLSRGAILEVDTSGMRWATLYNTVDECQEAWAELSENLEDYED